MDGFFNVNKEKGYTSFDVCNYIKHKFKEKKVGHSGTLDPNATGVMQVAVGKATKLLPLLEDHNKTYIATVRFGILTDTLDPEGNVLETNIPTNLDLSIIKEKVKELSKKATQIPPIYSAIKDYPMFGVYENLVDSILENTPYRILKAWIKSESVSERVMFSLEFHNACLYSIHQRRIDPYIEVNPRWKGYICSEYQELVNYLINKYVNYK